MIRAAASSVLRRQVVRGHGLVNSCRVPLAAASTSSSSSAKEAFPQRQERMAFHSSSRREEEAKAVATTEEETEGGAPGWWDPAYALPLGMTFAVPAIHYEWYLVNEETQLAVCFTAFCVLVYSNFGTIIKDSLEAEGKANLARMNAQEDALIEKLGGWIGEIKAEEGTVADLNDIKALKIQTYEKLNAAGKVKPLHDFKAQVEKLLTQIAAEEANMLEANKTKLMEEATMEVEKKFASDKALKKAALDNAIGILQGGGAGGNDPVKETYLKFFAFKKTEAGKIDAKAETAAARESILVKLNATAKNDKMYLEFDEAGKPKMVA